jgi:hypothetical protein
MDEAVDEERLIYDISLDKKPPQSYPTNFGIIEHNDGSEPDVDLEPLSD